MRGCWLLLAMTLAGCVGLNGDYQPGQGDASGATGGAASTTSVGSGPGSATANPSGTTGSGPNSGPGSMTMGDPTGDDPSTGSVGETTTGTGPDDSSESGVSVCPSENAPIVQDAFLVSCAEDCASNNYGTTASRFVGGGATPSVLLLRVPARADVDHLDLHLSLSGETGVMAADYTLTAFAVDPPCNWQAGEEDGAPVQKGDNGVTAGACETNSGEPVPWEGAGKQPVIGSADEDWIPAMLPLTPDVPSAIVTEVVLSLTRLEPGPTPHSIVVVSNVEPIWEFRVYSADSEDGPWIDLQPLCEK